MDRVIHRTVGGSSHFLNVSSGEILTFDIDAGDAMELVDNWQDPALGLGQDVVEFFEDQGQANSRLCRANLNVLGTEFGFPTIVNIELNRRCSLRCVHCYLGEEIWANDVSVFEEMTEGQIVQLLQDLKAMGAFLLVLTGGEPFLNKKMATIVYEATRLGFVLEIFSNLQYLPRWFRRLMPPATRIGRIQTSVYSASAEQHDSVTTVAGSHARTMKNLLALKAKGFYVEVATPLMCHNYSSWRETETTFRQMGIMQDFSWPILSEYYGQSIGGVSLNVSSAEFAEFCAANPSFLIERQLEDTSAPVCEAGHSLMSITALGDVYSCSQLPVSVGNITGSRVADIYASAEMEQFRQIQCRDVGVTKVCNFCIGNNYSETGDFFRQPEFMVESISAVMGRLEVI